MDDQYRLHARTSESQCLRYHAALYLSARDRPADLPAAGTCSTEPGAHGSIVCAACTHDDGSAARSCRIPGVVSCDLSFDEDGCFGRCTLEDGSVQRLCNSPRGPELVQLP